MIRKMRLSIVVGVVLALAFTGVVATAHPLVAMMTARGGMMGSSGMEGCMEMMPGWEGGHTQRPNEQWRQ
jgi:hypothetical protein